ncbi:MAG: hypothetical protein ABIJ09_07865 [Pseudomonadota bacterium]
MRHWPLILLSLALHLGQAHARPPASSTTGPRNDPLALDRVKVFELDGAADYVQRYASNPPSAERLARARQVPIARPHPHDPLWRAGVNGNIVVVEGGGGYAYNDACPSPNQSQTCTYFNDNAIFDVANEVLPSSNDVHDMIVIFTTFAQTGAGYAAYYLPIQNDIQGLGDCNEREGETHGCVFDSTYGLHVQGLMYMSSVRSWADQERDFYGRVSPVSSPEHWVYGGLGHESLHRWGSALRFVHPRDGAVSKAMLGESLAHWNPSLNAKGSMHYGYQWQDNGDGSFDLLAESTGYWDVDLYAMGVLPANEVQPWFLIEGARSDELRRLFADMGYNFNGNLSGPGLYIPLPPVPYIDELLRMYYSSMGAHITATGSRLDLGMDDVLAAEGPRVPAAGAAPDRFRQVFVLLTAPGETLTGVGSAVAELEQVRQVFERWFVERTGGRARLCTLLSGDCPEPELVLRGRPPDDGQSNGNGAADADESVDLFVAARNEGDAAAHGLHATLRSLDEEFLTVDRAEAALGDLEPGEARETTESLLLYVDKKAPCAAPLRYQLRVAGTDTGPEDLLGFVYVGLQPKKTFDFEDDDEGWRINPGDEDDATAGAFARGSSRPRKVGGVRVTPAGQASGASALFTDPSSEGDPASHDVDGGFTSLRSPTIDLEGLRDPHLAYRYWHVAVRPDGSPAESDDNRLLVELAGDDGKFKEVRRAVESAAEWRAGLVRIRDEFDPLPKQLRVRITQFDDGDDDVVEAGIDLVQILEPVGACEPAGCGCRGASGTPAGGGIALVFLLCLRRRRARC